LLSHTKEWKKLSCTHHQIKRVEKKGFVRLTINYHSFKKKKICRIFVSICFIHDIVSQLQLHYPRKTSNNNVLSNICNSFKCYIIIFELATPSNVCTTHQLWKIHLNTINNNVVRKVFFKLPPDQHFSCCRSNTYVSVQPGQII